MGHQQDVAARKSRAFEQQHRFADRTLGALAVVGHHLRRQRIDEQFDVGGVVGQRRHDVGIVGVGDQRDLPAAAFAQDAGELGAHLQQAGRRQVGGPRGLGQVHRDDQRRAVLPQGLRQAAPARPGQGQDREGQRQRGQHVAARDASIARIAAAFDQVMQQVRIDRIAPHVAAQAQAMQPPRQHRHQDQREQPGWPHELEVHDEGMDRLGHLRHAHRDDILRRGALLRASSSTAHSSAPASGHA